MLEITVKIRLLGRGKGHITKKLKVHSAPGKGDLLYIRDAETGQDLCARVNDVAHVISEKVRTHTINILAEEED